MSTRDDTDEGHGSESPRTRSAAWAGCAAAVLVGFVALTVAGPDRARAQEQEVRGGSAYGGDEGDKTDYHEVRKGDTLWDISGQYFGDPHEWPRVWSFNSHVTNPHWIYPGDIVYLEPPGEPEKEGPAKEKKPPKPDQKVRVREGLRVSVGGFVVGEEVEYVGRIVDSPKEARLLGQFDTAWIGFGEDGYTDRERDNMNSNDIRELKDPGEVRKKDRFAIVESAGKLKNEDNDVIGYKYIVLGSLVVTATSENKLDTAHIDQSWREIERGAFLVPYERQLRTVDHVEAEKNLVAHIVDSLRGTFDFGEFEYVFLDKGADDGVRIGNRLYVYQRKSGIPKRWGGAEPSEIPWRRVGRVRVVDVTKNYSTALITDAKREIAIGDRLEMYEGN